MNKTITLVALVLLLGGVSAIDWNSTAKWNSNPKIIIDNNDTNLTGRTLSLFYGPNVIVVLADNKNGTSTERNVSIKDFSYTKNTEFTITTNDTTFPPTPASNVRLSAKIDQTNGADQVTLYKGQFVGGPQTLALTKNDNKTVKLTVLQVLAHRSKYIVVYKIDNGTVNVASVDTTGTDVQTIPLTNNGTKFGSANCAGLSGKDNGLYCLWQATVKDPKNATNTVDILAEAVITSLATTNNTPFPADFNQGNNYNMTSIDFFAAYNAGKEFGGVISVNKAYSTKNGNTNKTVALAAPPTPTSYQAPQYAGFVAYKDQLALLYTFQADTTPPTPPGTVNLTSAIQYVQKDGTVSSWNYLFGNATQLDAVQYSDGSFYVSAANLTHAYLGAVWGSTGLSASIVQTAFAAVCAFAAAIFLL